MDETLFPNESTPNYLLDLEYKGPSFDGMMEIIALKNEIAGLEEVIQITAQVLAKNKKIDFNPSDMQIFIEAFEKGSFRKRVKVFLKGADRHPCIINLAIFVVMILQTIPLYRAAKLTNISPQLISEIGDQVKIELLKNGRFLNSLADVVRPLEKEGDRFVCTATEKQRAIVEYKDKKEFLELAGETEMQEEAEGNRFEILQGRINRVDLDARIRHIGFKIDNEGVSVPATLTEHLRKPAEMQELLGKWIEMEGTTTYQGGTRAHINIAKYKIIYQSELFKEDKNK